jgi:hypothetical protein
MSKLLSKQVVRRAEKLIQDVATRWWSTYSMVECLLRLKIYFAILQEEGNFEGNLTEPQWKIIDNLKTLLQTFMISQRLLKGESYVTISLVPFMIYKIRKDLSAAVDAEQSSHHVVMIGRKRLEKMNEIFGAGHEVTVAYNVINEGNCHHPRGIPQLALMAHLFDRQRALMAYDKG